MKNCSKFRTNKGSRKQKKNRVEKKKHNWQQYYSQKQGEAVTKLYQGKKPQIFKYGWTIIIPFIEFLESVGIPALFITIEGADIIREMLKMPIILKCYCIKVLLGVTSRKGIRNNLIREKALMLLIGFTSEEIEKGLNCRGGKEQEGPMHPDSLINLMGKLSEKESERVFNEVAKIICQKGYIDWKEARFAQDSTFLKTTIKYEGYGTVTVEKQKRDKKGKLHKIKVYYHGFKLLIVYEVHTRLIVAAKVVQIQEHDSNFTEEMIKLAEANTGRKINLLVIDRGFLDGEQLWHLHKEGTNFIIPSKSTMDVTLQAQTYRNINPDGETVFRQWRKGTTVMGITGLNTYDQYGDNSVNRYSKKFSPNLINAIMVTRWKGDEYPTGKEPVFLTDLSVNKPYEILEEYDLRSLIENTAFRELKQGWKINIFPKKTKQAVWAHIFLTLMTFNLCHAFQLELKQPVNEKGIRALRDDDWKAHNLFIVFTSQYVSIFDLSILLDFFIFDSNENISIIEFSQFYQRKEVI